MGHDYGTHHNDIGLTYFNARWLDSDVGRFTQVDPTISDIRKSQDWNPYVYVRNDPINEVDPTGKNPALVIVAAALCPECALAALGIVAAVAVYELVIKDLVNKKDESVPPPPTEIPKDGADKEKEVNSAGAASQSSGVSSPAPLPPNQEDPDKKSKDRSKKSLKELIKEHKQKLEDFKKNPEKFDNQGRLKNAPNRQIREKIIEGRVKHLQDEINEFQRQLNALSGGGE